MRLTLLLALVLAGSAGAAGGDLPPRRRGRLLGWLAAATYRATYTPEPAVHVSAGPHGGNVRTWYSPVLVEDLRAGRPTYRRGAAMVKELYFRGSEDVIGYSVMRKLRARSAPLGRGWLFYESFDGTNDGAYFGRGLGVCTSCHRDGADFLLSPFRP